MKEKIINILTTTPLSISQTRRAGTNGLRNADEIADLILSHIEEPESVLKNGPLVLDLKAYTLHVNGVETSLTPKEFKLLKYFMCNKGKMLFHRDIMVNVWGIAHEEDLQYSRVFINQIREKIGGKLIRTEPGVGYKMLEIKS